MKYIDEYRDSALIKALLQRVHIAASRKEGYRLMEFCGGHTHALYRYGLISVLPETIRMVHGPGCPVCVLPAGRIDAAVELARKPGTVLCTYGDMIRVPGSGGFSLLKAKAEGADVQMVYSPLDAVKIAQENRDRQVVFFAVGFETTAPATALAVKQAQAHQVSNFSIFCNHVLTPPAMRAILGAKDQVSKAAWVDGIIGPGHVSAIIGSSAYRFVADSYQTPLAISGFEPVDLLESMLMLIKQINEGRAEVENQYARVVSTAGNSGAIALMEEVFALRDSFEWRGLGVLADSALTLAPAFGDVDAENRFEVGFSQLPDQCADHKACRCADVLRGLIQPEACSVFAGACTPEHPLGACMVSSEGACAAAYSYGGAAGAVR